MKGTDVYSIRGNSRRSHSTSAPRLRLGAACLAVAGILFVLYPATRPFSDETSLQGAAAFASTAWIVAHMMAMVGFTLLLLGVFALDRFLQDSTVESLAFRAFVVTVVGVGLILPFYGVEAFGLHAIGQEAVRQQSAELLRLANAVRSGPGLLMFGVGLLVLAVGAIMLAAAVWKSGKYPKWSGIPLALGFALYIPQFWGTQPVRVAHGLLVAAGCLWIAAALWSQSTQESER